jgi:hypothetical protein
MPIFQDSENAYAVVPEGDYVLCVYEFSSDLSTGKKTTGAKRYNIVFTVEGTDSKIKESLIDHESCIWKIDTFLKSCGIRNLQKGQAWEFEKDEAEKQGVPWINPMGLRCHAAIIHDTYTSQRGNEVTKNKIAAFYTDREVLPPDPVLRKKPTSTSAVGKAPF